jgi:hypothetical protein
MPRVNEADTPRLSDRGAKKHYRMTLQPADATCCHGTDATGASVVAMPDAPIAITASTAASRVMPAALCDPEERYKQGLGSGRNDFRA